MPFRKLLFILLLLISARAYSQQDVDFHLSAHLLQGQKILKVKRDYHDPYLWVLAQNNAVYRVNSLTLAVDDYSATFSAYNNLQFIDIAGRSKDTVFIGTNSNNLIEYKKGVLKVITQADGLTGNIHQVGMDHIYEGMAKLPGEPLWSYPPGQVCHLAEITKTLIEIQCPAACRSLLHNWFWNMPLTIIQGFLVALFCQ